MRKKKIFLVIPQQQFEINFEKEVPNQIRYEIELNNQADNINAEVNIKEAAIAVTKEKRVSIENPLKSFKVVYPAELQHRVYSYHHYGYLYAFTEIAKTRAKMLYLYGSEGSLNPLPKRNIWILLENDFFVATPDVLLRKEQIWLWGTYQPLYVNLKDLSELCIKSLTTGEEKIFPCEPTFFFKGDVSTEDDFKEQSPIFTGNSIKIVAPKSEPSGWVVCIQDKIGNKSYIEDWKGEEPLEVINVLPSECGEFQVDIYNREGEEVSPSLFFRYIPSLKLIFPTRLILPTQRGHKSEIVQIFFEESWQDWKLELEGKSTEETPNGYEVHLSPDEDTVRFRFGKINKPQTETDFKITIPRLRWKTSLGKTWLDKPFDIRIEQLVMGEDLILSLLTNDISSRYSFQALLKAENNEVLQEAMFIKSKNAFSEYEVLLNQFYDTIKETQSKAEIIVKIWETEGKEELGAVEVIHFIPTAIIEDREKVKSKSTSEVRVTKSRGKLKILRGVVVSDKMDKTIVVVVDKAVRHPLYPKVIRKTCKFKVHDEFNEAKVGDVVEIMETRPLSKTKRWRLIRIVRKKENDGQQTITKFS